LCLVWGEWLEWEWRGGEWITHNRMIANSKCMLFRKKAAFLPNSIPKMYAIGENEPNIRSKTGNSKHFMIAIQEKVGVAGQ
jgi:hypothetical protein